MSTDSRPESVQFSVISPLEQRLAAPMYGLSLAFLFFLAGALHLGEAAAVPFQIAYRVCLAALVALYPLFIAEFCVHRWAGNPRWKQDLLLCLLPPLRLGSRDHATGSHLWFPRSGWMRVTPEFQAKVEKAFGLPMIIMALLVLPLMGVEQYMAHRVVGNATFEALLHLAGGLIWLSFTFEFIVMVSISDKKAKYCAAHWIDIAVILLPLVMFLRALRLGRLLRLQQLSRTARIYRMRGTMMKAYKAVLLLNVAQRLLLAKPERRLAQLREKLVEKEHELETMRAEIRSLEAMLQESAPVRLQSDAA